MPAWRIGMLDCCNPSVKCWRRALPPPPNSTIPPVPTHMRGARTLHSICPRLSTASPGFETVQIEPALGDLQWAEASMPYSRGGTITVKYERTQVGTKATVTLPEALHGVLAWQGRSYPLRSGEQQISLPLTSLSKVF